MTTSDVIAREFDGESQYAINARTCSVTMR
jgi:hypothetical protein